MITTAEYRNKTVAVLGLARTGLAACRSLMASGATVYAFDDDPAKRELAALSGVMLRDLTQLDWQQVATLVLSPGIPHRFPAPHPVAAAAARNNVPVICDLDLFFQSQPEARIIGVTGTNGKSTTTSLIAHILKTANYPAFAGGNIGQSVLDHPALPKAGVYVLELSSYQLERIPHARLDVAVLLNVTPDHLDRHGGWDGYRQAKERVFDGLVSSGIAILGEDTTCDAIASSLRRRGLSSLIRVFVEMAGSSGISAQGGILIEHRADGMRRIADLQAAAALKGAHNWQNAAAAYAACRAIGLAEGAILEGLITYPGLAHRQELVAECRGIAFVNDSKATNADAAAKALGCYDHIYWIAGGRAKEDGLNNLEPYYPRIRHAFLIGEAMPKFAQTLEGHIPFTLSGTLQQAVKDATAMAVQRQEEAATILLSPACASFDQFRDFEERGEAFRRFAVDASRAQQGQDIASAVKTGGRR